MITVALAPSFRSGDLDALAAHFAKLDPGEADRLIGIEITRAIHERRIDDAVRWQRILRRTRCRRERVPPDA